MFFAREVWSIADVSSPLLEPFVGAVGLVSSSIGRHEGTHALLEKNRVLWFVN